jgi:hypothetical protein
LTLEIQPTVFTLAKAEGNTIMTKKHFELVARVLKDALNDNGADLATVTKLATGFANEFKKENDRFDTVRFLKAVGFVEKDARGLTK